MKVKRGYIALSIVVIIALITGTLLWLKKSKSVDTGKISEVQQEDVAGAVTEEGSSPSTEEIPCPEKNIITPMEKPPLDYEFTTVNNTSASMQFKAPATWECIKWNYWGYQFNAPEDDPYFPGHTFFLIFDRNMTEDGYMAHEMMGGARNQEGKTISRGFMYYQLELAPLHYTYDGKRMQFVTPDAEPQHVTDLSKYYDGYQTGTLMIFEFEDMMLFDNTTTAGPVTRVDMCQAWYALSWYWTTYATTDEDVQNIKKLYEYMGRSVTYETPQWQITGITTPGYAELEAGRQAEKAENNN